MATLRNEAFSGKCSILQYVERRDPFFNMKNGPVLQYEELSILHYEEFSDKWPILQYEARPILQYEERPRPSI